MRTKIVLISSFVALVISICLSFFGVPWYVAWLPIWGPLLFLFLAMAYIAIFLDRPDRRI